jgi:hypothetical protein
MGGGQSTRNIPAGSTPAGGCTVQSLLELIMDKERGNEDATIRMEMEMEMEMEMDGGWNGWENVVMQE